MKQPRPNQVVQASLEAQILLAMTYWCEYRTLYHIGIDFGIYESSASHIVHEVEYVLIKSGQFDLPKKLPRGNVDDINWSAVIIDVTKAQLTVQKNQSDYYSGKRK